MPSFHHDLSRRDFMVIAAVSAGVCVTSYVVYKWTNRMDRRSPTLPESGAHLMDMIPELSQGHVHMKDKEKVGEILLQMASQGTKGLQVVADFDSTLTRFHQDGVRCDTCYDAVKKSKYVPESYREETKRLGEKYLPIEHDPNLTIAQKIPLMIEWYERGQNAMKQCGFNKVTLQRIISESNLKLRSGADVFLATLAEAKVPCLIFSAGVGDVIEIALKQQAKLFPNIRIIANYMQWNGQGNMAGFQGKLIHSFNKNATFAHQLGYFDNHSGRKNVLLLGDTLGDVEMADGADDVTHCLKIAFLNYRIEENLSQLLEAYDVVLCDDQTMTVPNAILRAVSGR